MPKKYKDLSLFFTNLNSDNITLTFKEIEKINKKDLPMSARKYREYWANHINNSIAKSWMLAGYKITEVNFLNEKVTFVKFYYNNTIKELIDETQDVNSQTNIKPVTNKIIDEIKNIIIQTSITLGTPLDENDFYILHQPKHHTPKKLPKKKMAVYSFVYNGIFLKIGQAGSNSHARYESHHYNPNSSNSNLAKSLLSDPLFKDFLDEETITNWIKTNCERYDIIINDHFGKNTLNYIEVMLHKKYNPRYEG